MEYDNYDDDLDIYEDINNITALISVFMQKALESASYYTIQSGRKIVSSKDISMALKREMFIFMERDDIEEKTNQILDEIEIENQIKDNLNDDDLEKFEDLEKDEIKAIEDDFIVDDEDIQEEWIECKSDDQICLEMNFYYKKFDSFEPSNNFEKLVYNSIVNIDKQFNL